MTNIVEQVEQLRANLKCRAVGCAETGKPFCERHLRMLPMGVRDELTRAHETVLEHAIEFIERKENRGLE